MWLCLYVLPVVNWTSWLIVNHNRLVGVEEMHPSICIGTRFKPYVPNQSSDSRTIPGPENFDIARSNSEPVAQQLRLPTITINWLPVAIVISGYGVFLLGNSQKQPGVWENIVRIVSEISSKICVIVYTLYLEAYRKFKFWHQVELRTTRQEDEKSLVTISNI